MVDGWAGQAVAVRARAAEGGAAIGGAALGGRATGRTGPLPPSSRTGARRLARHTVARSGPDAAAVREHVACRLSTAGTCSAGARPEEYGTPRGGVPDCTFPQSLATEVYRMFTKGAHRGCPLRARTGREAPRELTGQYCPARQGTASPKKLAGGGGPRLRKGPPAGTRAQGLCNAGWPQAPAGAQRP